jgi:di/tricarboxylate transporter
LKLTNHQPLCNPPRHELHCAGGIFIPIIRFLSKSVGDDPDKGVRKRMGAFLMQSQLQQSSYSSALFLTSGAQNLLCLNLAAELGEWGWSECVCVGGGVRQVLEPGL